MQRLVSKSVQKERGFALLVTIVLVAFLVLILVGLATFTRVETQVAGNAQQLALARQNALVGLNVAIGQLQRYAGPDQRVTARADLAVGTNNPHYIGVWDSTVAGATATNPLAWLVSGNEVNGLANTPLGVISANPNAVLLVDKAANSQASLRVRVLKQPINSASAPGISGPATIGNFAYWVGDESLKARANLVSPWPKTAAGAVRDREAGYNFASAQRTGIEQMARVAVPPTAPPFGTAIGATAYVPNAANLGSVLSKEQLPFALPFALAPAEKTAVTNAYQHRFHDVTTHSVSLLTDTRQGGLKQDLTRLLESNAAAAYSGVAAANTAPLFGAATSAIHYQNPPTWGQLRSFANTTSNGAAIAPSLPSSTSQGIAPVLVWTEVGFGLGINATNTQLRIHFFPKIVLWNPYNVPLAAADYEVGYLSRPADAYNVTLNDGTVVSYKLRSRAFGAATTPDRFFRFRLNSGVIPPGESRLYTVQTSGVYNDTGDNLLVEGDWTGSVYQEDSTVRPAQTPPLAIATPAPASDTHTYLREWVPGQSQLAVNDPGTNTFQYVGRVGAVDVTTSTSSQALGAAPDIRHVFRANIAGQSVSFLRPRWILNGNIRAPYINRALQVGADSALYNPLYFGTINSSSTPPIGTPVHVNRLYDLAGTAADDLVLFQVPRTDTPLFSIADLRHANLSLVGTGPAYPIATSLQDFRLSRATTFLAAGGAGVNRFNIYDYAYLINQALWDRYFFSTVPATLTAANIADPTYALPNGRLTFFGRNNVAPTAADLRNPVLAAKNLTLKGGFNVNSTSVQAWRAQLSALNALAYNPVAGTDGGTALAFPFSRFNRPPAASANAWQGFRELTADQINALAEAIVAEVRTRGPFLSVGQFVNRALANNATGLKGPLQAAIDAVDLGAVATRINTSTPSGQDTPSTPTSTAGYDTEAYAGVTGAAPASGASWPASTLPVTSRNAGAPGHLTQADILAAIGAGLTARGDTFLVRTYGDVQNPATGAVEGRAWCEAVVQRLPDYVDPGSTNAESIPAAGTDNERFGRRFQVVSFRWLSTEDI